MNEQIGTTLSADAQERVVSALWSERGNISISDAEALVATGRFDEHPASISSADRHAALVEAQRAELAIAATPGEKGEILRRHGSAIQAANSQMQDEAYEHRQREREAVCSGHRWRVLSHEESECTRCGAIRFVPDYD